MKITLSVEVSDLYRKVRASGNIDFKHLKVRAADKKTVTTWVKETIIELDRMYT